MKKRHNYSKRFVELANSSAILVFILIQASKSAVAFLTIKALEFIWGKSRKDD
jgi:hypothetical protein